MSKKIQALVLYEGKKFEDFSESELYSLVLASIGKDYKIFEYSRITRFEYSRRTTYFLIFAVTIVF